MTSYRSRDLAAPVLEALEAMPVVVVTGMRQTGKTTFLQRQPELKDRRFVTLESFSQLEAARRNPEGLVDPGTPVTIDEAQKWPEVLSLIKEAVDKDRRRGRFLLSGSANFALLRNLSESLAGRAIYLRLGPFSRREVSGAGGEAFLPRFFERIGRAGSVTGRAAALRFSGAEDLWSACVEGRRNGPGNGKTAGGRPGLAPIRPQEVLAGGMPPVVLEAAGRRGIWLRGYEQTYLERDIRSLGEVSDLGAFRRILRLAALRTGQILNVSHLGRDAELPSSTARRYLSLMETSFVIELIPPYLTSRTTRLIKAPKVYFSDSGLAAHLAVVDSIEGDEPMRGALLETYVAQNLASILGAQWPRARLAYWTVSGRTEVDFVLEVGRECLAIEAKAASRWGDRDLAGLTAFLAATPGCRAGVLAHNGEEAARLGERLWALPLGLVLA